MSVSTLSCPVRQDSLLLSFSSKRKEFLTGYATLQEYISSFVETGERLSLCYDLTLWALYTFDS